MSEGKVTKNWSCFFFKFLIEVKHKSIIEPKVLTWQKFEKFFDDRDVASRSGFAEKINWMVSVRQQCI